MKYHVNSVIMTPTATKTLVAGSVCVCGVEFSFDASWDVYTSKTAVFKHSDGTEREVILTDGRCDSIPWEVLQCPGRLRVGVYGENGESTRPTLWAAPLTVHPGAAACEPAEEPTPSKWQQILELLEQVTTPEVSDEKYFDIDYDGLVSLKPEYRGKCNSTVADHPYSISDNGVSVNGSKLNELPKKIVIPEIINGTAVTGFQNGMFYYNYQVEELVIPNTITTIPDSFCRNAKHLVSIRGTENIESIASYGFMNTRIRKATFPNLKTLGSRAFNQCALLHTIDIGDYITEIPDRAFRNCSSLSYVKGGASVKTIGASAFFYTFDLKNLSFLPNVTNIGDMAFYNSRIQFDWSTLTECAFGTNATPIADNPTDYWSGCTYVPCENQLGSLFHQLNPLWTDETYGTTGRRYGEGCALMTIIHIHSALSGKKYDTPKEFEYELAQIDSTLLSKDIAHHENVNSVFEALGYNTTFYGGSTEINQEIMQSIYDALASGGYVFVSISSELGVNYGHAVALYGINDIGEVLVADSAVPTNSVELYDVDFTYRIPFQNITSTTNDVIIVRKP